MKKCANEIYNKIAEAKIGVPIGTRHANGMEYSYTIEDMLKQQGYKKGINYLSSYDYPTHQTFIVKLTDIKPFKQPQHNIQIGDIFYNSWGYDQTNVDFFQVVSTTTKTITLREIKAADVNYNAYQMSGNKKAAKDQFCSNELIRKTPYLMGGQWRISFEFGAGSQWDGSPMSYSCYA